MFVIASWMMGCFVLLPVPVLCGMATSSGFVVDFVERAHMATIRAVCRKMAVVNEEVAA